MTSWYARGHSDAGGALVELALTLPVLLVLFAAMADFARVFYTSMALTDAARAGAQYGAHSAAQTGNFAAIEATARAASNTTGITAVASRTCQCATDTGTFTPTATPNDCTSPVSTSCPSGHLVVTVTVVTSKVFTTIMSGGLPSFMRTVNLSRSATMRATQLP